MPTRTRIATFVVALAATAIGFLDTRRLGRSIPA